MQDNGDIEGEIVLRTGATQASTMLLERPILEALYKSVVKPKASIEFQYNECRSISMDDIQKLQERADQWTQQYDVHAESLTVTVKRLKQRASNFNSTTSYPSFTEFLRQEPSQSAACDSVGLNFNLLHKNYATGALENIEAEIIIENMIAPVEESTSIFSSNNIRWLGGKKPMQLRITYTDYIVAKSFQSIFEDWFDSLSTFEISKDNKFLASLGEYDPFGGFSLGFQAVRIFPAFSSICVGLGLLGLIDDTNRSVMLLSLIILGVYVISDTAFRVLVGRFDHPMQPGPPFLCVNAGDKEKRENYSDRVLKRKTSLRSEAKTIFISYVVSLAAGLTLYFLF